MFDTVDHVGRLVLTKSLVGFRKDLAKAMKKDEEEFGVDTDQHEVLDAVAHAMLKQLGWQPPAPKEKKDGKPKKADKAQMDWTKDQAAEPPGPRARIDCLGCKRQFAVEEGMEVNVACPDCGAVHQVNSSMGTVSRIRPRPQMPTHIYELWVQSKDAKAWKKAPKVRRVTLDTWLSDHPLWIESPELVPRGARVADPDVPGSGNPLRIVCRDRVGTECDGFDTFDTPGRAQCTSCAQPYKIELVEGKLNVTTWSLDDEAAVRAE